MSVSNIIERLQAGNQRFMSDRSERSLRDSARRKELSGGQNPWAIVLSCADSRVVPEEAFDTGLGELFVIRVAGNIANTSSIASIEYAVAHLGSSLIVVLGHESCGAVTAAVGGGNHGHNLNHLLSHITPALHSCGETATLTDVIKRNAELNGQDVIERSSIIRKAVENGQVSIVPAYYHLDSGEVEFY